jgi:hypothetical protein
MMGVMLLNVIMLNIIVLNVIRLSVVMVSVERLRTCLSIHASDDFIIDLH